MIGLVLVNCGVSNKGVLSNEKRKLDIMCMIYFFKIFVKKIIGMVSKVLKIIIV